MYLYVYTGLFSLVVIKYFMKAIYHCYIFLSYNLFIFSGYFFLISYKLILTILLDICDCKITLVFHWPLYYFLRSRMKPQPGCNWLAHGLEMSSWSTFVTFHTVHLFSMQRCWTLVKTRALLILLFCTFHT